MSGESAQLNEQTAGVPIRMSLFQVPSWAVTFFGAKLPPYVNISEMARQLHRTASMTLRNEPWGQSHASVLVIAPSCTRRHGPQIILER